MALLVCLASRAVGEYISGFFFFSHQITSGLLRSDQQSWIITGFFYSQVSPKILWLWDLRGSLFHPLEGWQTVDPTQPATCAC